MQYKILEKMTNWEDYKLTNLIPYIFEGFAYYNIIL